MMGFRFSKRGEKQYNQQSERGTRLQRGTRERSNKVSVVTEHTYAYLCMGWSFWVPQATVPQSFSHDPWESAQCLPPPIFYREKFFLHLCQEEKCGKNLFSLTYLQLIEWPEYEAVIHRITQIMLKKSFILKKHPNLKLAQIAISFSSFFQSFSPILLWMTTFHCSAILFPHHSGLCVHLIHPNHYVSVLLRSVQAVHIDKRIKMLDSPCILAAPSCSALALALRSIAYAENLLDSVDAVLKHCRKQQVKILYSFTI